ncbi:hypothetical protein [Burkholderia sp. WSM2232]|uniref:hypothetical protein n=1 Tax=Burkholderia sp. WSM2232 TaxID=944436 RepID=UPI000483C9F5|nr:hypothetical protein [Burkholderia sp. WSM2232]
MLQFQDQIALLSGARDTGRKAGLYGDIDWLHLDYTQQTEFPFCWFAFKSGLTLRKGKIENLVDTGFRKGSAQPFAVAPVLNNWEGDSRHRMAELTF